MPHTLLLADDSITIQRVIELTFADEDIRVVAVSDGKQAVQRAQAEAPDIVLADVGMPEMDGYEVAAFSKRTPVLLACPVGEKSLRHAAALTRMGHPDVRSLSGGIVAWRDAGAPLVRE